MKKADAIVYGMAIAVFSFAAGMIVNEILYQATRASDEALMYLAYRDLLKEGYDI